MNKDINKIEHESSYLKAYEDVQLLKHDVMRPIRIELEVLKPELYLQYFNVNETIVCFGSARVREEKIAKKCVAEAQKELAKKPKSKK